MPPNFDPTTVTVSARSLTDATSWPEPFLLIVATVLSLVLFLRQRRWQSLLLLIGFGLLSAKHIGWFFVPSTEHQTSVFAIRAAQAFVHLLGILQSVGYLFLTVYVAFLIRALPPSIPNDRNA